MNYEQTSPPRRNGRYCRICFANIDVVALLLLSHSEHAYATTLNGARVLYAFGYPLRVQFAHSNSFLLSHTRKKSLDRKKEFNYPLSLY